MLNSKFTQNREPLKERFIQITSKLNNLDFKQGTCKAHRIDKVNDRSYKIEEQINKMKENYNKQILNLKEQIADIAEQINQENSQYQSQQDQYWNKINELDQNCRKQIQLESSQRVDTLNQLSTYFNEKLTFVSSDLIIEQRLREEQIIDLQRGLENQLPKIQQQLKSETEDRELFDNQVLKKAAIEIQKSSNQLNEAERQRYDQENQISEMMQDLIIRVKADLKQLKDERQVKEEELIGLIEQTCDKIIQASLI